MSCGDCDKATTGYGNAVHTIYFHILAGIGFGIGAIILGMVLRLFGVRIGVK